MAINTAEDGLIDRAGRLTRLSTLKLALSKLRVFRTGHGMGTPDALQSAMLSALPSEVAGTGFLGKAVEGYIGRWRIYSGGPIIGQVDFRSQKG